MPADDKGHLGDHTHRRVDNHAGRRLRPGTAAQVRHRALAMSPPILATGNSELIDSRTHRIQGHWQRRDGSQAANSSRHERAEKSIGTMW